MRKIFKPQCYIILGIPVLFAVGTLFHFIYELSGENFFVGLFAPVNESVFEHTKMVALPIFLWWGIYYLVNKQKLRPNAWFTAALISMVTAIVSIPLLYYFYTGAFGVHLLWADIAILFFALLLGQLLGLHYYRHGKGINCTAAVLIMVFILILFAFFTVIPPKLPIFQDSITGAYGIK